MATEVVETIGSGGDYADISSWVAGLPSDLTSVDEVRIGRLIDAADYAEASTITISGITTDATRYVQLEAASGVRHNGTGDATGARYAYTGGGHAFQVDIDHFRTEWIDYSYPSGGGSSDEIFRWTGTGEFYQQYCLFHDIPHSDGDAIYPNNQAASQTLYTANCLFWSIERAACHVQSEENLTWYVYNSAGWDIALGGSGYGLAGFSSSPNTGSVVVCKNVYGHVATGGTAFFDTNSNGDFTGSTNNASSDASAPGANALTSQDPSTDAQFVSLSGTIDLHIQSGSTLEEAGADLSADANLVVDDDIDAESRTAPYDIGADEISTSGDTTAPTLTNPTASADGSDGYSGSVDTDEGNGTLYHVVTQSSTAPSAAQVKAGQDHTGAAADASGNQTVSATGTQNVGQTGVLSASTQYWIHYMHEDAATNQSSVASSTSFTTASSATNPPDQPTAQTPLWIAGTNARLHSSAYSEPDGDAHQSSDWQVDVSGGDFSSPVYEALDSADLEEHTIPQDTLSRETDYIYRVRHTDTDGDSTWSAAQAFTTTGAAVSGFGGRGGV